MPRLNGPSRGPQLSVPPVRPASSASRTNRAVRCGRVAAATLACTGLVLAAPARAQDLGVQMYGVMDLGVFAMNPGVSSQSTVQVRSGQALSRWGLRGREDLGGGNSVIFNAEALLYADDGTGQATGGGLTFQRRSFVGITGPVGGTLTLGRDYTPGFWSLIVTDLFSWAAVGNVTAFSVAGGITARSSNAVFYNTPTWGGFRLMTMYGTGERDTAPKDAGRIYHVAGFWDVGHWTLTGYYGRYRSQVGTTPESAGTAEYGGGFRYSADRWRVVGGYSVADPSGPGNNVNWWNLGVEVPAGTGAFLLQYTRMRAESGSAYAQGIAGKAGTLSAMYTYPLSKRTNLYVAGGVVNNDQGGRFGIAITSSMYNPAARGLDPKVIGFGIRHFY